MVYAVSPGEPATGREHATDESPILCGRMSAVPGQYRCSSGTTSPCSRSATVTLRLASAAETKEASPPKNATHTALAGDPGSGGQKAAGLKRPARRSASERTRSFGAALTTTLGGGLSA